MDYQNLLSVSQREMIFHSRPDSKYAPHQTMKKCEAESLHALCDCLQKNDCNAEQFDGFFVGYTIPQISKEFDLLRVGNDEIINIELKSRLVNEGKNNKFLEQMKKNHYYLSILERNIVIITYAMDVGFYMFNPQSHTADQIDVSEVVSILKKQRVDYSFCPNKSFVPSKYLISPFNSTKKFIEDAYFLTDAQQEIKTTILSGIKKKQFQFYTLSAKAGTGKTLLIYDIIKTCIQDNIPSLVIHVGMLNDGHHSLKWNYHWNICSIKEIKKHTIDNILAQQSVVVIDEAQRISERQLEYIVDVSIEKSITLIFAYDVRQFLKQNEGIDISAFLTEHYPNVPLNRKQLTTKIRTNKQMASFIQNLRKIGSSNSDLNYDCASIEYFSDFDSLSDYLRFLQNKQWTKLTFTTSSYQKDPFDDLAHLGGKNAHNVIGQEFPNVVLVLDHNFYYEGNRLTTTKNSYYDGEGMLYQLVTRVVNNLKIIVFNNPELYIHLMDIKCRR